MLCILSILANCEEIYGYELVKAMSERSGGLFDLPEGTIYPVLYRLEEQGFVQQCAVRVGKRMNRYYYRLTDAGRAFYQALLREYEDVQKGVQQILYGKARADDEPEYT